MTTILKALDISFGSNLAFEDPDRFRAWCEARLAQGDAEMLVVNCWTGSGTPLGAEEALRIAREAGLLTAGYCAIHDGRTGEEHVYKAMDGAGAEEQHLRFMAIDCEEIPGISLSAWTIADALQTVENADQRPMIYTAWRYWARAQTYTEQFASYPLWEAYYGQGKHLRITGGFGGWPKGTGVGLQYQGTTELDGVPVDLNVFDREFISGGEEMPEYPNLPKVVARAETAIHQLWALTEELAAAGMTGRAVEMQRKLVELKRALGLQEEE